MITTGGLLTSVDAEVLNPFDEPISRLYAAGEVTGGKCVGYPGCGTAIAECIIFGRIAGRERSSAARLVRIEEKRGTGGWASGAFF